MKLLSLFALVNACLMAITGVWADMRSEITTYRDGGANLSGHLYRDDSIEGGRRPVVLAVHELSDLNDHARWRAGQPTCARADLEGVVGFQGSLPLPNGGETQNIRVRVLIKHGNHGARHGFTNPDAGSFGVENLKYREAADESSWRSMQRLFEEIFQASKRIGQRP